MVSIITPVYNCGRFIESTILSVRRQTISDWEMIVVDDCSTDNTVQIVRDCANRDNRIHLICNEKNSGAAVSRNTALRKPKENGLPFLIQMTFGCLKN